MSKRYRNHGSGSLEQSKGGIWYLRTMKDGIYTREKIGKGTKEWAQKKAKNIIFLKQAKGNYGDSGALAIARNMVAESELAIAAKLSIGEIWQICPYNRPVKRHSKKSFDEKRIANNEYQWTRFADWADGKGLKTMGQITADLVDEFLRSIAQEAKMSTVRNYRNTISAVLKMCGSKVKVNPVELRYECDVKSYQALSEEDRKELASRIVADDVDLIIMVMLFTGLRLGDAINIKWTHIKEGMLTGFTQEKDGSLISVPLQKELMDILPEIDRGKGSIYARENTLMGRGTHRKCLPLHQWHRSSLSHAVTRRLAKIFGAEKGYSAHSLRATFATFAAESGTPMAIISSWMGHDSAMVTRIYAKIGDKAKKFWIDKLDYGQGDKNEK